VSRRLAIVGATLAVVAGCLPAGCGEDVQSPDLFLLTRSGHGPTLTLLPDDGGSIRCNGGKARALSDPLLIAARDLAQDLDKDARHKLTVPRTAGTIFYYRIRLEHGTIAFPDSAARSQKVLARATLFAAQAAQSACGLSG
jgi:hypothetical protein